MKKHFVLRLCVCVCDFLAGVFHKCQNTGSVYMDDSFCCLPETATILVAVLNSCASIENKKFKNIEVSK